MSQRERFHVGYGGEFRREVSLYDELNLQSLANLGAVNRVQLILTDTDDNKTTLDSDVAAHAGVFDWSTYSANRLIIFKLGIVAGLAAGTYKAQLVLFDAANTQGQPWGDEFTVDGLVV